MTSPSPGGTVDTHDGHHDLVLVRTFAAPIADIWAWITESDRTARWFASWTGTPEAGNTVQLRMQYEDDASESAVTILACDEPHHLEVTSRDEYGSWHLEGRLTEADGITTLTFVHHLDAGADAGSIGPGWEYYLDRLVAARDGGAEPDFDDYFPAQQAYYQALTAGS